MNIPYSSTTLKYFTNHCPKALNYYQTGAYYPKEIFQPGIAAHAIIEQCGIKQPETFIQKVVIANAVIQILIEKGHSYYNQVEPPMNPESAFLGRNIALEYLGENDVPKGKYEISLGMDSGGNATKDPVKLRYRALIDCTYEDVEGDEDFSGEVIVVRDYKTAWPTGTAELETLQRKGQIVLAWLHLLKETTQGIRAEVVNLRTGGIFSKTIWIDEEGIAILNKYREEILSLCTAADATKSPRIGMGCVTCPWSLTCEEAKEASLSPIIPEDYCALEGRRKEFIEILKEDLKEESVEIPGGMIGYNPTIQKGISEEAIEGICSEFYPDRQQIEIAKGLLKSLKLGAAQVKSFAKIAFDDKEDRADFLNKCLKEETKAKFGIWT